MTELRLSARTRALAIRTVILASTALGTTFGGMTAAQAQNVTYNGPGDYTLFDTTALLSGSLGANVSGAIGGYSAELQIGDLGNDVILHVAPVPEPGSAALALAALGAFAGLRPSRRWNS